MNGLRQIGIWFQGKKTILGGGLLIVAALLGAFFGKLPVMDAVAVAGFGISVIGQAAKANRHQSEILSAITAVATAGVDLRAGNRQGALDAITPVIGEAITAAGPALSVHVSGSDPQVVLQAVSALQVPQTLRAGASPYSGMLETKG